MWLALHLVGGCSITTEGISDRRTVVWRSWGDGEVRGSVRPAFASCHAPHNVAEPACRRQFFRGLEGLVRRAAGWQLVL